MKIVNLKLPVPVLAAVLFAGAAPGEPAAPVITIQAGQPGVKINPSMWRGRRPLRRAGEESRL
jgi:hypothetical protein